MKTPGVLPFDRESPARLSVFTAFIVFFSMRETALSARGAIHSALHIFSGEGVVAQAVSEKAARLKIIICFMYIGLSVLS